MRTCISILLAAALPAAAVGAPLDLAELFGYPFVYGTAPRGAEWSPDGTRLAFLWNDSGERFRDLYVVAAESGGPVRLTDLRGHRPLADDGATEVGEGPDPYDGGVSQLAWSPDGRSLAFTLHGDVFLVPVDGGTPPRELIRSRASESKVCFSPDGALLSFVRGSDLWTVDLASGSERQLTALTWNRKVRSYPSSSPIELYRWSPDSAHLAVLAWDTSALEEIVIPDYLGERVTAESWRRSYVGTPVFSTRVGVVDRAGGPVQWIDLGEPYYHNSETHYGEAIAWSPDARTLLVNWNGPDYRTRRLLLSDLDGGPVDVVYQETQEPFLKYLDAQWSPDGSWIYTTSERDGYRHVYAVPRAGGEPRQITSGPWDVLALHVPTAGDELLIESSAHHPLERHVYAVPVDGGQPRRLTRAAGSHTAIVAPDGSHVAVLSSAYLTPPELVLIDPDRETQRPVTASPLAAFADLPGRRPEYFTCVNQEDGATLHGFMLTPSWMQPGERHPAVLSCVYADIAKNDWIPYDLLDLYMAEEMGYVVVRVDFRASDGYGRDFRYGYYQRMGLVDATEAVSVAAYLRTLPFVDGERIGIWGSSYGGFLTLMTLFTHPGEFHTGVAWKPVTDWLSYTDDYTAQRLGRPQEFPEVYRATSPIHHVAGLADNLLVVHGMVDDNVLVQDTIRLVQALLEVGKEFDLMLYPRADHGLTQWDETRVDLMRRTARYFRDHLGEVDRPAR